jgi:hypothetical protein
MLHQEISAKNTGNCSRAISDSRYNKVGAIARDANRYAINFLYNQRRPSWRRQTWPRTSRPVIVRLGMMTVRKCQALVIAGRWLNPRVRRMAVIVPSLAQSARFMYGPYRTSWCHS